MLVTKLRETEDQASNVIGVRIIAQDSEEQKVLRRFWDGGMKMNTFSANGEEIGITFEDLIECEVIR